MAADSVLLHVFGPPALTDAAGRAKPLRTRKQLGLLIYLTLAARERPVSRDHLADLLWGEVTPARARHSLAQALTAIRTAVGNHVVSRGGNDVRLVDAVSTELDRMRAGEVAPDLGRPLAGAELWAGSAWAHWVEGMRVRLAEDAAGFLRAQLAQSRTRGAADDVFACARMLYRVDPLSDLAVLALGESRLVRGDVVGAIKLLQDHLTRIEFQLGCNPHPHVARLLRRLEVGAHPPVETVPARLAAVANRIRQPVFVGRTRALATLEGEWERVLAGKQRAGMVMGPGGIGKSSLLRRFAAGLAARAFPVMLVSCQEMGHGIPFAAAADLIAALVRDPAVGGTDPMWLAEASRVTPIVKATYPGIPEPTVAPPESIRIRLAEALFHILETVADGQGIALLFDDFQHMDPATRDVLFVLQRRLEASRVILMGTRTAQRRTLPLLALGRPGQDLRWDIQITLPPLSRSEVEQLISEMSQDSTPSDSVRDKIVALSEGNPYFVEMLVTDWKQHEATSLAVANLDRGEPPPHWRPPDTLRLAFAKLYEGLDDHARQMLQVLAVARSGMTTSAMSEMLGIPVMRLDRALLQLIARDIVWLSNGSLTYRNDIHRAYTYWALGPEERKYYHLLIAYSIKPSAQHASRNDALERGYHLQKGGANEQAADQLLQAARTALSRGAPLEAEHALKLASDTGMRPSRVAVLLAESMAAQGRTTEALVALDKIDQEHIQDTAAARAAVLRVRCQSASLNTDRELLRESADAALELSQATRDPEVIAEALQCAGETAAEHGDRERLKTIESLALRLAEAESSSLSVARATLTVGYCRLVRGDRTEAIRAFQQAVQILDDVTEARLLCRALNGLGIAQTGEGLSTAAHASFRRAVSIPDAALDPSYSVVLWTNLAGLYHDTGDLSRAVEASTIALRNCRERARVSSQAVTYWSAATLALDIERPTEAARLLSMAEESAGQSGIRRDTEDCMLVRADLYLATGEPERAWPLVDRATPNDRHYTLGALAYRERLSRHYCFVSQGYGEYVRQRQDRAVLLDRAPLATRLEVEGFHLWLRRHVGEDADAAILGFIQRIRRLGLLGVLIHLETVGCGLTNLGVPNLPSTHRVARFFGDPCPSTVPERLLPAALDHLAGA